jgi:hypothetical protein
MLESIGRTILPVFVTIGLLLSILIVCYAASWMLEFHL